MSTKTSEPWAEIPADAVSRLAARDSESPPGPPLTNHDPINPAHYRGDAVMRIIEEWGLGFCLGNVIKYVLRHGDKAGLEDLKKARWYLDREIQHREGLPRDDPRRQPRNL